MAKKMLMKWVLWIVTLFMTLAVGELFVAGTFLDTTILGYVPDILHTIVGWVIVIGGLWGSFTKLPK